MMKITRFPMGVSDSEVVSLLGYFAIVEYSYPNSNFGIYNKRYSALAGSQMGYISLFETSQASIPRTYGKASITLSMEYTTKVIQSIEAPSNLGNTHHNPVTRGAQLRGLGTSE